MDWSKLSEIPVFAVILFLSLLFTALATITEKGRDASTFVFGILKKVCRAFLFGRIIASNKSRIDVLESSLLEINQKLDVLIGEVKVNGGTSLRDMLNVIALKSFIESESRRKLLDSSGLPFWESDNDGNCVYASERLSELVGLETKDVLGSGWVTNLKPEDTERVFREWNYAVKQRRRFIQNYTFVHEDGVEVRVQGHAQPIVHNNKVEGFVGILTVLDKDR